mmetsp:Transcript_12406/g.16295  ORF Transcript_12406/g.16295 Transcript_12406/m.16295 type:complete len:386 (+) Transcript_12406:282-1439(+)|eukprot:CAMPEP_0198143230 /NCGR_PEP_ID=MMETSP1443-20131203/6125_1 /TAXON_ID=186043 /ORGANISM="Entomoneis sp., Strain CCMP2396" /LENGTH=385 /DNA_ID=CAMNT_0043806433 /DNA_START=237 /DNA_END=1394 /DNA_ORIENTATION=-
MTTLPSTAVRLVSLFYLLSVASAGWGTSDSASSAIFGNALNRDWLYDAKGISIEVHGCLNSFMNDQDGDGGCMQQSSEDGTDVWYQMSNCRRAQVAWSVYASDSSGSPSCNSNTFKESFVTKSSVNDFIDYISNYYTFAEDEYGGYYPSCGGGQNNNNQGDEDDKRNLEAAKGISCGSDASFQIEQFDDNYCLASTGNVINSLDYLNKDFSNMNCLNVYGDNGNRRKMENGNIVQYLISISETCSSWDSGLCTDSESSEERHGHSGSASSSFLKHSGGTGQTWFTKLKYVSGGLLLLASFVMFTGILFTNRRRRRALMQRKYRQAKRGGRSSRSVDGRSRRSSRSASKARDSSSRKSSSRSRRRSKSREQPRKSSNKDDAEGVLT